MCDGGAAADEVRAAAPRAAPGPAGDPIGLEPVDEVVVTTLVDNVFDGLLDGGQGVVRAPLTSGMVAAPQFESGRPPTRLPAEPGVSPLVTVRRGSATTTLLFDTGISPDGMTDNADRLGIDLREGQGLVLSHRHSDPPGARAPLAPRHALPMPVPPLAWPRRRQAIPGAEAVELPTLSRRAL